MPSTYASISNELKDVKEINKVVQEEFDQLRVQTAKDKTEIAILQGAIEKQSEELQSSVATKKFEKMRAEAADLKEEHELLKKDTRISLKNVLTAIHELPKPCGLLQRRKKRQFKEAVAYLDSLLSTMSVELVDGHV